MSVISVGVGKVLNNTPFTETGLPVVGKLDPEKSSIFMFERVMTLIVFRRRGTGEQRGESGEHEYARLRIDVLHRPGDLGRSQAHQVGGDRRLASAGKDGSWTHLHVQANE